VSCARPLYAPASSADGQRLEDRDRVSCAHVGGFAVTGEPLKARELAQAASERRVVTALSVEPDRVRDALQRVVQPAREVRGVGVLLEYCRLLAHIEVVEEVGEDRLSHELVAEADIRRPHLEQKL
jgi:hypothetical protein